MHLAPVGTHFLTILTASIEVGHLVCTKHVVHILSELCLQRSHHRKLFTNEDLGEEFLCSGEHHCLLAEVLNEGSLGQELRHIAHLMAGLLGKHLTCTRKNGGTNKYRYIRKIRNQFLHQCQILRTIVLTLGCCVPTSL